MSYVRDPYDTDEPPCVCGLSGPARTTEEFCPSHGDPDKPFPDRMEPCTCPCHDETRSPICQTCCDDR